MFAEKIIEEQHFQWNSDSLFLRRYFSLRGKWYKQKEHYDSYTKEF